MPFDSLIASFDSLTVSFDGEVWPFDAVSEVFWRKSVRELEKVSHF